MGLQCRLGYGLGMEQWRDPKRFATLRYPNAVREAEALLAEIANATGRALAELQARGQGGPVPVWVVTDALPMLRRLRAGQSSWENIPRALLPTFEGFVRTLTSAFPDTLTSARFAGGLQEGLLFEADRAMLLDAAVLVAHPNRNAKDLVVKRTCQGKGPSVLVARGLQWTD